MWQIYPDPGETCYASNSPILVWTYWVCNIVTDIYLILIPLPVVLRTRLTSKQKFALVTLFSCTIGITIFGVARLVLIELVGLFNLPRINGHFLLLTLNLVTTRPQDSSTNADGVWAVREVFVATITTNFAPVVPLIRCCVSFVTGHGASSRPVPQQQWSVPRSWALRQKRKMMSSDGTETTLVNSRRLSASAYLTRNDIIYPYPEEIEMVGTNSHIEREQAPHALKTLGLIRLQSVTEEGRRETIGMRALGDDIKKTTFATVTERLPSP